MPRSRRRGAGITDKERKDAQLRELEALQSRRTTQRARPIFEERARKLRASPGLSEVSSSHDIVPPLQSEDDSHPSSPASVRTASPIGRSRTRRRKAGRRRKTRRH